MKEITGITTKAKTTQSVKKEKEVKVELKLMGTIRPQKGQTVFEINEETGDCKPATYKSDTVAYPVKGNKAPDKLILNKDCIYIPALNVENAKKKYLKNKEQDFYYAKSAHMKIEDLAFGVK
jgi:hypothetical protein